MAEMASTHVVAGTSTEGTSVQAAAQQQVTHPDQICTACDRSGHRAHTLNQHAHVARRLTRVSLVSPFLLVSYVSCPLPSRPRRLFLPRLVVAPVPAGRSQSQSQRVERAASSHRSRHRTQSHPHTLLVMVPSLQSRPRAMCMSVACRRTGRIRIWRAASPSSARSNSQRFSSTP